MLTFDIYVPTETERQIVISEFLANPVSDDTAHHFNPMNREFPPEARRVPVEDEFIELVNLGSEAVDLAGWTLSDSTKVRHRFPNPTALAAHRSVVVYGASLTGSDPRLTSDTITQPASESATSGLGLNNGGDRIELRNVEGRLIRRIQYTDLDEVSGSLTRASLSHGEFIDHTLADSRSTSPGTHFDGQAFVPDATGGEPRARIRIQKSAADTVEIRWPAAAGMPYTVWGSPNISGPFQSEVSDLIFPDGNGRYESEVGIGSPHHFWRISTP